MTFAKCAFQCSAPAVWNSLPKTVLNSDSVTVFKSRLKTLLFSRAFSFSSAHFFYHKLVNKDLYINTLPGPSASKLRPNGAIQIYLLLLLLLLLPVFMSVRMFITEQLLKRRRTGTQMMRKRARIKTLMTSTMMYMMHQQPRWVMLYYRVATKNRAISHREPVKTLVTSQILSA